LLIGEQVVERTAERRPEYLLAVFLKISTALAPYVNRTTIQQRSPEARLAGRLFSSDDIICRFFKNDPEGVYIACQNDWQWNARYWEQRAILLTHSDVGRGVQYARTALSIELHSHTLTTLARMLLAEFRASGPRAIDNVREAFDHLREAIERERRLDRVTIHPFFLFLQTVSELGLAGHSIDASQRIFIRTTIQRMQKYFPRDVDMQRLIDEVRPYL
jgi:hypothetical protein